jgi:hypothetical protein
MQTKEKIPRKHTAKSGMERMKRNDDNVIIKSSKKKYGNFLFPFSQRKKNRGILTNYAHNEILKWQIYVFFRLLT